MKHVLAASRSSAIDITHPPLIYNYWALISYGVLDQDEGMVYGSESISQKKKNEVIDDDCFFFLTCPKFHAHRK